MIIETLKAVVVALILLSLGTRPVSGQQITGAENRNSYADLVKQSYGHDQNLINGVLYYNRYVRCKGLPYLISNDFVDGELTIQGRKYNDISIRYDILSQCVEIVYFNIQGNPNWLFTVSEHVESFLFGEYPFKKLNIEGSDGKFYQVIQTGPFTCYIHWEKKLLPLQNDPDNSRVFSEVHVTCLLEMDGKITYFKNRRSFSELFPLHQQKEIRRLFRTNHYKIKKASPAEMVRHMNEVADILNSGGLP